MFSAKSSGPILTRIKSGEFLVSIQIDPPANSNIENFQEQIDGLIDAGVTLADVNSSRSSVKRPITHDSIALSSVLSARGLEVIPHVTLRDSSLNGLLKQMVAGYLWGDVKNFLIVSGDPHVKSDVAQAPGVFERGVPEVIQAVDKHLRNGADYKFKDLAILAAFNQNALDLNTELKRVTEKSHAGCDIFMSQIIFTAEELEKMIDFYIPATEAPIIIGVFPMLNYQTIDNIYSRKISGIVMPQSCFEEASKYKDDKDGLRKWGTEQAIDLIARIKSAAQNFGERTSIAGVYVAAPTRNPGLVIDIISSL